MPDDRLPTWLWLEGVTRTLSERGIFYYILQRGDKTGGLLLIKISNREGQCKLLTQQRNLDGELEWVNALGNDLPDEPEADAYVSRATARDPDLWVVEIEDPDLKNPF